MPGEQGDGLLLFGVREQGQRHDDFPYVSRVVGAHYVVNASGNLEFIDELRELYAFEPTDHEGVAIECGLSSLEYDPYHHRLYLMTSFETEVDSVERIGGYLWLMELDNLTTGEPPALIRGMDGTPFEFEHKAEGLAVLDHERVFVVYDNDREMGVGSIDERDERHASEALYTLLHME